MERILIIDDEDLNLRLTKHILVGAGYEVMTAKSGIKGIELLRKNSIDLLLLDIEMPEMDGLEVLRRIREIPEIAKTKVVFLTSSTAYADLSEAARLEAEQFIQKPCMSEELLKIVRDIFLEKSGYLLLVVDDEPMNRLMMKKIFSTSYRVECVSSGIEAIDFIQNKTPDMILMDIMMPEMDGRETFEIIKSMKGRDSLPVIFMTADEDDDTETELFRRGAMDFIRKPFVAEIARERVRRIMELKRLQYFLHEEVERKTKEVREDRNKIRRLSAQIIYALANAIDAKDAYTNGHSTRVAGYSREIAMRMGKSEDEVEKIYFAAMLHDVGKIGIPREILGKTTRLTDEEFAMIKEHTVKGEKILETISEMPSLTIGARSHHERYDGKGYPDGLKGEEINEIARIICVADCYDAMSSNRSYRKALSQARVREQIEQGRGRQFDARIADIMLQMIDEDTDYEMREILSDE